MGDRAYKIAHCEEDRARGAAYREAHKAERKAYNDAWRAVHPEEIRAYREAHREENHAVAAAYREVHRDARKAYATAYRAAHPEKVHAHESAHRARKRGAPVNDLSAPQWREIQAAFGHRCAYCGKRAKGHLTQDHIMPLFKGGSHTLSNVVPACQSCNSRKGTRPPPTPIQPFFLTIAPSRR